MSHIVWKGSPNKDSNRKPVSTVVLHWFGAGTIDSANSKFQNPQAQSSAHYGISNHTIYQWVKEEDVAWHSGVYAMNQKSIGIETDGNPDKPHTETTIKTTINLVAEICKRHNIPADRQHIIKHSEVKATQCPGTLPIDRIVEEVNKILNPPPTYNPTEDEQRATTALKKFKDQTVELKNGNMEGAQYATIGAYKDLPGILKERNQLSELVAQMTIEIRGEKDKVNSLKRNQEELAVLLGSANDSAVIKSEVGKLRDSNDLSNPATTNDKFISDLVRFVKYFFRKRGE